MIKNFNQRWYIVLCFTALLGIGLRLYHWLQNRSLWLDEAYVALGVSSQPFMDILSMEPFSDTSPLPPVGFSILLKICVSVFGNNELVLRLTPLVMSIAALFVFYRISTKIVDPPARLLAFGFMSLSPYMINYAAELKQYSGEVLAFLILLHMFLRVRSRSFMNGDVLRVGFTGITAILISHTSIFMLVPVCGVLLVNFWKKREHKTLKHFSLLCFVWGVVWGSIFYRGLKWMLEQDIFFATNRYLAPASPFASESWIWLMDRLLSMADMPASLWPGIFWLGMCVFGLSLLYRRDKMLACILAAPLAFNILAAMVGTYVFGQRFILYWMPVIYLSVATAVVWLVRRTGSLKFFTATVLIGLAFYQPIINIAHYIRFPANREDNRQVVEFLLENYQPGDTVIINNSAFCPFSYYQGISARNMRLSTLGMVLDEVETVDNDPVASGLYQHYVYNKDGWVAGMIEYNKAGIKISSQGGWFPIQGKGERVWVLFSHFSDQLREIVISAVSRHGKRAAGLRRQQAEVYLYVMDNEKNLLGGNIYE